MARYKIVNFEFAAGVFWLVDTSSCVSYPLPAGTGGIVTKGTEAECEKALLLLIAKDTGEAHG